MIDLCERQKLSALKRMEQGLYLGTDNDKVLLPNKEIPEGTEIGDELDVFIYLDSKDRYTATLKHPNIELGKMAILEVTDVTKIGAFLDWGLDKELLLPYKEQTQKVAKGDKVPVVLYIDRTGRPAATMHVYNYLEAGGDYVKDSAVWGTVIQINEDLGIFLAIDNKYFGMIPIREFAGEVKLGDVIHGRVSSVRPDGKYMVNTNQKSYIQIDDDAEKILQCLKDAGGELPYGDKSDSEEVKRAFSMSKNAFKKAIGRLYKNKMIDLKPNNIRLI